MRSRVLTVSGLNPYTDSCGRFVQVPLIRLQGKWLEKLGFKVGSKVEVSGKNGKITLKLVKEGF